MAYDNEFYNLYEEYLQEPRVRDVHNMLFRKIEKFTESPRNVLDLGCGLSEYSRYGGSYDSYVGIDKNNTGVKSFILGDYTDLDFIRENLSFEPTVVISLFSIECCFPREVKYALYDRIFKKFPSVNRVIATGFYYKDRRNEESVRENGGVVSYQTIENQSHFLSSLFRESRVLMPNPSNLFGENPVEVWKFLKRK